eukprot:jgi/Botrbrau1/4835/Bobra.0325s0046.2
MLTSGWINAALGFYEPAAAKRLGVPPSRVHHSALLGAVAHLREPPFSPPRIVPPPPPRTTPAAFAPPRFVPPPPSVTPAAVSNVPQVYADAAAGRAVSARTVGSTAAAEAGNSRTAIPNGSPADRPRPPGGAADSAAAVPAGPRGSALGEDQQLRAPPGDPRGPVSGAAPSGSSRRKGKGKRRKGAVGPARPGGAPTGTGGPPVGPVQAMWGASSRIIDSAAIAAGGIDAVRKAWGKTSEAGALYDVLQAFPTCTVAEVGLCCLDPALLQSWGYSPAALPPMGASPDALLLHPPASLNADNPDEGLLHAFASLQLRMGEDQPVRGESGGPAPFPSPHSSCFPSPVGVGQRVEVLEIKNVCPFVERTSLNRKGHVTRRYFVSSRGPSQTVATFWIPQLQLEMAASGAESALLVSRSLTQGMAVFRVRRDEAYLKDMMEVVALLYCQYVRKFVQPPVNMFMGLPVYERLLQRTLNLARHPERLQLPPFTQMAPNFDSQPFLR